MTRKELEKEVEEKTKQYMNEHTEKYNCENTKLETDNYNVGREYGYEDGYLDGAESREKRIAELEKEKSEIINLINDCLWSCVNKNFDKVEEGLKSLLNEYDE